MKTFNKKIVLLVILAISVLFGGINTALALSSAVSITGFNSGGLNGIYTASGTFNSNNIFVNSSGTKLFYADYNGTGIYSWAIASSTSIGTSAYAAGFGEANSYGPSTCNTWGANVANEAMLFGCNFYTVVGNTLISTLPIGVATTTPATVSTGTFLGFFKFFRFR